MPRIEFPVYESALVQSEVQNNCDLETQLHLQILQEKRLVIYVWMQAQISSKIILAGNERGYEFSLEFDNNRPVKISIHSINSNSINLAEKPSCTFSFYTLEPYKLALTFDQLSSSFQGNPITPDSAQQQFLRMVWRFLSECGIERLAVKQLSTLTMFRETIYKQHMHFDQLPSYTEKDVDSLNTFLNAIAVAKRQELKNEKLTAELAVTGESNTQEKWVCNIL
ncbi:hypothetical protein Lbir_1892 [Legionella birminghamensis]|uniref:Uncharacterized protein n=1 Tax=Legionella birminghamensis TaxID=28083 RepID=A0A378IB24_9GAMM|nr:hypothetical protein [Legionella birminghamensis]KTC70117.1 hypothetical protein Lbir_1892 [Legionella birminghamensis]STX31990.1 Uncharacterised protein [Legionella birminghamensis]